MALLQASSLFPEALSKRSVSRVEAQRSRRASPSPSAAGRLPPKAPSSSLASGRTSTARAGSITISGGIVNAHGGDLSAAIGCSVGGSCGEIKISGGTVNAVGGPGTSWSRPGRGYHQLRQGARHHRRDGQMQRGGFNEGGVFGVGISFAGSGGSS